MNQDFVIGLQVTGLGMGLVFLTLILIMLAIMLLDRLFRSPRTAQPSPRTAEAVSARAPLAGGAPAAQPLAAAPSPPSPAIPDEDETDLVAALAVAIVSALSGNSHGAPEISEPVGYPDLPPEVVTVVRIDPGPSNWVGQGRLESLN